MVLLDNDRMKNYLYHFEFFSGFYESYFYKQHRAKNEKEAIIEIVSYFNNSDLDETQNYLNENLGKNWTTEIFWSEMDMQFNDDVEGYTLHWIKEIDFDLDDVGKLI